MDADHGVCTMSERDGLASTDEVHVDVVQYPDGEVKAVPAGTGADVVRSYEAREQSQNYLRKALFAGISVLILAYSVLVVRNLLLGVLTALLVYAGGALTAPRRGADAALLDDGVTLRTAREQWEATPVSALTAEGADRRERERDHAVEGEV
jgi:hypothetical protein